MDNNTNPTDAQVNSSNDQPDGDDEETFVLNPDPVGDVEGNFALVYRGHWAAVARELLDDGLPPASIPDAIAERQARVSSLRFVAAPSNGRASMAVTAYLGDDRLDVNSLDPAKVNDRLGWVDRLHAICGDIDKRDAERKFMDFAADLAERKSQPPEKTAQPPAEMLLQQMPQQIRDEARAMLEAPDLMARVAKDIAALGVAGEENLVATTYLVGTSRLLPEPAGAIVQAPSATGKSYTISKVGSCFPPEATIFAHSITPNALYYMPPGSLGHKFVVCGERSRRKDDDAADATKALREMRSDGVLRKLVTDTSTSPPSTYYAIQEGPIAYIESTTASEIFSEDKNRNLVLTADERPEQTQRILSKIAAVRSGAESTDSEAIIQKHHAAQRMLRPLPVVIPFAQRLAAKFPAKRVEARRAFGYLCTMIEASALLHQFQRQITSDGRIVASLADYEFAAFLCRDPLARLLGGKISDAAIRFHERLRKWKETAAEFSTTEAAKWDAKTNQAIRDCLHELAGIGAVEQTEQAKGSRPAQWRLTGISQSDVEAGGFDLPTVTELDEPDGAPTDPDALPF